MTDICSCKRGKKLEAFCLACNNEKEENPMCSLCIVEHNNEVHGCRNIHVKDIVEKRLGVIKEKLKDLQPQKDTLRYHHISVLEQTREKEKIKKALEKKLKQIRAFWESETEKVKSHNTIMLKCQEQLVKEIAKCEHRVNENAKDPEKVEKLVKNLIRSQDYWTAYNEVQQSMKLDAKVEDSEIKVLLGKYKDLYNEYEKQYKEIERSADIDFIAFKEMKECNEKLVAENKALLDEIKELKAKLDSSKAENVKEKGNYQELNNKYTIDVQKLKGNLLRKNCR